MKFSTELNLHQDFSSSPFAGTINFFLILNGIALSSNCEENLDFVLWTSQFVLGFNFKAASCPRQN
jgi:hypothetical protein